MTIDSRMLTSAFVPCLQPRLKKFVQTELAKFGTIPGPVRQMTAHYYTMSLATATTAVAYKERLFPPNTGGRSGGIGGRFADLRRGHESALPA